MNQPKLKPFIITAKAFDRGFAVAVPLGVALVPNKDSAWQEGIARWPNCVILEPQVWEDVPPPIRLFALEADRQNFSL